MSAATPNNGHEDHFESSAQHARAAAEEMRGAAQDLAQEFKDRANALAGEWKAKARRLHKGAERYVRENPTKSVLTAVGVGFVVGLIFRR